MLLCRGIVGLAQIPLRRRLYPFRDIMAKRTRSTAAQLTDDTPAETQPRKRVKQTVGAATVLGDAVVAVASTSTVTVAVQDTDAQGEPPLATKPKGFYHVSFFEW